MENQLRLANRYPKNYFATLPLGTTYYKCLISPYDLGYDTEYWGHSFKDLATTKKDFKHDVNIDLDGDLDYGFMAILEMVVMEREDGSRYGHPTGKRWVNNFGHWQTEEKFTKERFGYTHEDYLDLIKSQFR